MATKKPNRILNAAARGVQAAADAARTQAAEIVHLRTENERLRAEVERLTAQAKVAPVLTTKATQAAEVEFVSERHLEAAISTLIDQSTQWLYMVSPYVRIATAIRAPLHAARKRGVETALLCRANKLPPDTHRVVQELFGQVLEVEHLHSKCYLSPTHAIICSLNLYDVSSQNLEMGVVVPAGHSVYKGASTAVRRYHDISTPVDFNRKRASRKSTPKSKRAASGSVDGHCIRCRESIPMNDARPFCRTCYGTWAEFGRDTYPEKYCHACGAATGGVSFAKPSCRTCYVKRR